jgi:subtilisin family serine protease
MDNGIGTPQTYIECYQWFVAPTQIDGSNPDPTKAPNVINNSWACPISEGYTEPDMLLAAVQNVRAAGILTVHSAGNSGASCGTVNTQAAIYDESFTVGNTTSTDTIAGSSSRGPVTIDGSNNQKPDVSAPGVGVRSALPGTSYGPKSGTSMAAPHVAGLVALLVSARPSVAGQVDELESIIRLTAVPLTTTQNCTISGSQVPNNTYGWGRIDAWAAYQMVLTPKLYFPFVVVDP